MAGASKRSKKKNKGNNRGRDTITQDGGTQNKGTAAQNMLPKLGVNGLEKVPSNAPTMAIAPSDYEHIYHEGPVAAANQQAAAANQNLAESPPPERTRDRAAPPPPVPIQTPPVRQTIVASPPPPRSPTADQYATQAGGGGAGATYNGPLNVPQQNFDRLPYSLEVQVTPDGYTMLGQAPDPHATRRVALPPHIVRASNQFSRAALARVARYLASRADANPLGHL